MDGAKSAGSRSAAELVATFRDLEAGPRAFGDLLGLGDAAVEALASFLCGPPESIPEPRCLAAEILAAIGTPQARMALRAALDTLSSRHGLDPVLAEADSVVGSEVAGHLGALNDIGAAELLLAALRHHAWPGCARALGRLRDPRAISPLADRLDDDGIRPAAVDALRVFGASALSDLSRVALRRWSGSGLEPGWRIAGRAAAATLLGEHLSLPARMVLTWLLSDDAPLVRLSSAIALTRFGCDTAQIAVPALVDLLGNESWIDADTAADGLVAIGTPALPALTKVVTDESADPRKRRRAIAVLGSAASETSVDELASAARSSDGSIRLASAMALDRVPGPLAAGVLTSLLKDRMPEIRARAVDALGRRGSSEIRAVAPLLGDPDPGVAGAARMALEGAGAEALPVLSDLEEGLLVCRGGWTGTRRARSIAATIGQRLRLSAGDRSRPTLSGPASRNSLKEKAVESATTAAPAADDSCEDER